MNFSPKLGSFRKKGQIRNQWRQMYSSQHIHREYNNFFQGGMVPKLYIMLHVHADWCLLVKLFYVLVLCLNLLHFIWNVAQSADK